MTSKVRRPATAAADGGALCQTLRWMDIEVTLLPAIIRPFIPLGGPRRVLRVRIQFRVG